MKYIKGFDTIRFLAVLIVVVAHWGPYFGEHSLAGIIKETFFMTGRFGVNLFFVLSGFLITTILINEKVKNTERKHFTIIKNFFIRRVLRIFPIYYLVIIVCCLCGSRFVIDHIWYYITYTSNIIAYESDIPNILSHTWSLAVEEQFYLIWPWVIILINRNYLKYVPVAAIIMGLASKYIVMYIYHHNFPVLVINCFDSFGMGALYAYVRQDEQRTRKFEYMFKIMLPLLIFFAWRLTPFGGISFVVLYARALDGIIGIALIMFVLNNKSEWMRKNVLENRVLNYLGTISYGIYLYHFPLGPAYDDFIAGYAKAHPSLPAILSNFYTSYCIKMALLVLISALSFRFIEQPVLRLKKRFAYT